MKKLSELFEEQTGMKAPNEMPIYEVCIQNPCSGLFCNEHCKSCWNTPLNDETKLTLKDNFSQIMSNYRIGVIDMGKEYYVDCYGNKIS